MVTVTRLLEMGILLRNALLAISSCVNIIAYLGSITYYTPRACSIVLPLLGYKLFSESVYKTK